MQYWILQHSPSLLPGDTPYPPGIPPNMDYWHISRYAGQAAIDDVAFIWHAGVHRGIYDVAKVRSVPPHNADAERLIDVLKRSDDHLWADRDAKRRLRGLPTILIERQYLGELKRPLLVSELQRNGFGDLPVIAMPQRGIYRVGQAVGARLLEYIRQRP